MANQDPKFCAFPKGVVGVRFNVGLNESNITIADIVNSVGLSISKNAILGCQELQLGTFEVLVNSKEAAEKLLLTGIIVKSQRIPVHIHRNSKRWIWIHGFPLSEPNTLLRDALSPYGRASIVFNETYEEPPRILSGIRRILIELNGKEIPHVMTINGIMCCLFGTNVESPCYVCGSYMCEKYKRVQNDDVASQTDKVFLKRQYSFTNDDKKATPSKKIYRP